MRILLWGFIAALAAGFATETAFFYIATAKRVDEAGVWMPRRMRATAKVLYFVGALTDVIYYNWLLGTVRFRELPRWGEWTFSQRVERHFNESTGQRLEVAQRWAALLNVAMPGHIKAKD